MNALASLLTLVAACLAALVIFELRPQPAGPADPVVATNQLSSSAPAAPLQAVGASSASLAAILLARPMLSQTRRPPNIASPIAAPAVAAAPLPRMTGILIDGAHRSAIFASSGPNGGGRPTIVPEGGRIGPFTVQSIEPQQVIVIGPEGKRIVRTSFDPTLLPPPSVFGLGTPSFPGIVLPGGPPVLTPPTAPGAGYGLPQSAGAAR